MITRLEEPSQLMRYSRNMVYKIEISAQAEKDLDSIMDYITRNFMSEEAAINTMQNIQISVNGLSDFPEIGIDVSDRLGRTIDDEKVRMSIAGSYLVFYLIVGNDVVFLRVLYQKQNWIEILKKAE